MMPQFRPLEGVRILSFEAAASLPAATRALADLGADVVRVAERPGTYNQHLRLFDSTLINKQSIRLDLKEPRSLDLAKQLASVADVVCSNFRPSVMPRLGLDYETLRALKSDLIVLQLSGYGTPGPWQDFPAYGPSVEAAGGMNAKMGTANEPPLRVGGSVFADTLGGRYAALAICGALVQRDATGEGQYIDLSMYETIVSGVGDAVLRAARDGEAPARLGSRDELLAPQGIYPCLGDDEWVAITVATTSEWAALVDLIAAPSLADESYRDVEVRRRDHELIDGEITEWTSSRSKHEAAEALQARGIAAGPVLKSSEVASDEHHRARGFFQYVDHAQPLEGYGRHPHMTVPGRAEGFDRAALSDHNPDGSPAEQVLERWLGLSHQQIEALRAEGAVGELVPVLAADAPKPSWFGGRDAAREPEFARRLGLGERAAE